MKIVKDDLKRRFRMMCPICKAILEAKPSELLHKSDDVAMFYCPTCGKIQHLGWGYIYNVYTKE